MKNDIIFIFTLHCGASERFHPFEAAKRSVKIKKFMWFFPCIPLGQQGLGLCQTPYLCHFRFLSNRDTYKQY